MRKLICTVFVLIYLMSISIAHAQLSRNKLGWYCGSKKDWEFSQVVIGESIIVNNFIFKEKGAFLADRLRVIEVSYSVTNKASSTIEFNSQIVGMSEDGLPVFALAAKPMMSILSELNTDTISGNSYYYDNSSPLKNSSQICINFIADI